MRLKTLISVINFYCILVGAIMKLLRLVYLLLSFLLLNYIIQLVTGLQAELMAAYKESELVKKKLRKVEEDLDDFKQKNAELAEELLKRTGSNLFYVFIFFFIYPNLTSTYYIRALHLCCQGFTYSLHTCRVYTILFILDVFINIHEQTIATKTLNKT